MSPGRIVGSMAGRSSYEVVLSDEERAELEHRAVCYTRPYREVQRARLVLYAAEGNSNVEIGERLELSPGGGGALAKMLLREAARGS
jgi:hypothetical protein